MLIMTDGLIITSDVVMDFYHQFLREAAEFLDAKLDQIDAAAAVCDDPETFGQFERFEYVAGLGFVACQEYITAVSASSGKRGKTLHAGPRVGDNFLAELVNAGANYWKHHHEWTNPPRDKASLRTAELLRSAGVDPYETYVVANLIAVLAGDHSSRFAPVVQRLTVWRDDVLGLISDQPKRAP